MLDTRNHLEKFKFPRIQRKKLEILQINLGYKCNQQCLHCHVNAGPNRTEMMSFKVVEDIKVFVLRNRIKTIDLTGGAPELHPEFRNIIIWARDNNIGVIDRCNLTVLFEPGQGYLPEFLSQNKVQIFASMPCYLKDNVDKQRGKGVFDKSIEALKLLNASGYGKEDTDLILNLVYNPQGPHLPPPQAKLEAEYKSYMRDNYKISFNNLLAFTNLPIARFGSRLLSKGQFFDYMQLLQDSYRAENLQNVMCRSLLSIDWKGRVYNCDFNQMLKMGVKNDHNENLTIKELNYLKTIDNNIKVAGHCFGCVSGQGSSCSGALS